MRDLFRPNQEPERTLYDAFQKESGNRKGREVVEWIEAERMAVWRAAREYSEKHGLRVPTMEEIERAETSAYGHVDYGAKWAYGVARHMRREE